MTGCLICGREGRWQLHHPTGRGADGEYLDPGFTVPLCHDHHTLVHDNLKTLGLEGDRPIALGRVALRLTRSAVLAALAESIAMSAELFDRWASDLIACDNNVGSAETSG